MPIRDTISARRSIYFAMVSLIAAPLLFKDMKISLAR